MGEFLGHVEFTQNKMHSFDFHEVFCLKKHGFLTSNILPKRHKAVKEFVLCRSYDKEIFSRIKQVLGKRDIK